MVQYRIVQDRLFERDLDNLVALPLKQYAGRLRRNMPKTDGGSSSSDLSQTGFRATAKRRTREGTAASAPMMPL